MIRNTLSFLLKLCPAVFLAGLPLCSMAQSVTEAPMAESIEYHQKGRDIYNYRCYFCHGYSGDAQTLTSTFVFPQPRDFTRTSIDDLTRDYMLSVVTNGKPETAMTGFSRVLMADEIAAVVDFVRTEFMLNKLPNTHYHTLENGWPNHHHNEIAFPFATGEIPLDRPWDQLNSEQVKGKQLFLKSCITCHDRAKVLDEGVIWKKQSISFPRNNYSHTEIDVVSTASIYAQHDVSPMVASLSESAAIGKTLWLDNCAFCHAADGSGQNWIGSFLDPSPRDLRQADFMSKMNRGMLIERIENGLKDTSMPAWKSVLSRNQVEQIVSYISEAFYPVAN